MNLSARKTRFYLLAFLKHDFRASITVFFVALPLCLGISLASGTPVYSGLIAGIVGGLIIGVISSSQLSVSGPAAGLTAICASAILDLGAIEIFFLAVALAGLLQVLLGVFKLGGFTHFIPSAVIKGMLTAIGVILISKQVPAIIGYDQPDFWSNELFNIFTFRNVYSNIESLFVHTHAGAIIIASSAFLISVIWNRLLSKKVAFIPSSFIIVLSGAVLAFIFKQYVPALALKPSQYVQIPSDVFSNMHLPQLHLLTANVLIWKYAVIICIVASLETLLSIAAIDKLDPYNRITPQNKELIAQGTGNIVSGLMGGIPVTAVIVRSSANAEAGARTKVSAIAHGVWLLLVILVAAAAVNTIPYSVLAVILLKTGYNLAKPTMIKGVYKQGREQFMPFMVTIIAILFTDLLIGVIIGIVFSLYFLIKHTYRAGYTVKMYNHGHSKKYEVELALNVSFLNKKRIMEMLDKIPEYSSVEITGADSVYIDHDILEIIHDFKSKARLKHIELVLKGIPDVQTIELH